jgi:hypothetical protein
VPRLEVPKSRVREVPSAHNVGADDGQRRFVVDKRLPFLQDVLDFSRVVSRVASGFVYSTVLANDDAARIRD